MTIMKKAAFPADNPVGVPLLGGHGDQFVLRTNVFSLTAAAGFPISNVANPATHNYWKGVLSGSPPANELIWMAPGAATPIDYIAIAGHNFNSANIGVFAFDGGVSPPFNLLDASAIPPDNSPLIIRFDTAIYGQPTIRLDLSAATAAPQIAVIYMGKMLVLERGIKVDVQHTPINMGRKANVVTGMSESGNFLGRIQLGERHETTAEFFGFTNTFYRASMEPFLQVAIQFPFFWAWLPTDHPEETAYAWLLSDPQALISPDHGRFAVALEMGGIVF